MKNIRTIIIGSVILLALAGCSSDKKTQLAQLRDKKSALEEKIKRLEAQIEVEDKGKINPNEFKFVGLMEIKTGPFDHFIRVQGKLDGDQNVGVFAETPGTISAKYADVGQRVVKDQVLAQIDDKQYKSQLEGLETQYKLAQDMFDKQKRLWDQKIGSEVQYLQIKTNKESLERQIASLKQQIEKFRIKSPISGTIEECNIKVGGVVSPDPRQAAYRVVEFRNMKVTAEVSEAYSAKVKKGDKLVILFPDANRQIDAEVSFVSDYINPVNRTFMIEARIEGSTSDLKANMLAIIQINDYHTDNAVMVPMNLIQNDNDGSYVYITKEKNSYNAAFKQLVQIGNTYNGVAEVVKGLSKGDRIVSAGFQELVDGQYVRF